MRNVVVDTNVLLAILPKRSPYHSIWSDFLANKFVLCVSNDILEEYAEILASKTHSVLADNVLMEMLYRKNVKMVDPRFRFHLIEADPDDNKFVDCAIAANADYLVSNDAHFRVLKSISYPHVNLLTVEEFIALP